jgi:hypothetical protein
MSYIWIFESPDLTPSDFCLWVWIKSEVYKERMNTPDELPARILGAAARINGREDELRQTTGDLRKPVAKCLDIYGGSLENYCEV